MFGFSAATSAFELCAACALASPHPHHPPYIQTEESCVVDHSFGVGKECNVCIDCPEFPVRHPFQTTAPGCIPEITAQFWERRNGAFISVRALGENSPSSHYKKK